jgi:hypothetical protein
MQRKMNSQRHVHALRVQLLAMSRLSQRALDYSVKGYELRNLDFARQVGTAESELEKHYHRIKDLCRETVNGGIANDADFRLAFAALSIAAALHVTYSAAAEMARGTIHSLESGGIEKRAQLRQLGQTVNASMRLCVIALFERDAYFARTALGNEKQALQLAAGLHTDRRDSIQEDLECTVKRGLMKVAKQTHEIADALLFWLEGNNMFWVGSTCEVARLSREVPQALRKQDATLFIQPHRDLESNAPQTFSC